MVWLEKQIFSIEDVNKIVLLTSLLSDLILIEECGLPRSQIESLQDSLIASIIKTIKQLMNFMKNRKTKKNQFWIYFIINNGKLCFNIV